MISIPILIAILIRGLTFCAAALEWRAGPGYRAAAVTVPVGRQVGFTEVATAAGLSFTNLLGEERSLTNQIYLNGSGVALGDVDGDGWCDVYFCGLDSPNALYRNLGNWRFEAITGFAGVACPDQASTGAAFADMDGDGDLDLLVNGVRRGTRLFLNDGSARFTEVTGASGLRGTSGSASMTLADVDGDGRLDLYVVNYRNDTMRDMPDMRFRFNVTNGVTQLLTVNGRPASSPDYAGRFSFGRDGGILENGEADVLYRNEGGGRFAALSWTNGMFLNESGGNAATPHDWGLSAMFRDLNGDGAPDLYVCNDFQSPDRLWLNDGTGRFRAIARSAIRQTSLFSMGVDVADINRDGYDDLFVADMLSLSHARRQVQVMDATAFAQFRDSTGDRPQFPRNTVLLNRGNGTYGEVAQFAGLDASEWSWCPVFLDVDLDGYEDLLITSGHGRDAQNVDVSREIEAEQKRKPLSPREQLRLRGRFPPLETPNVAFRNRGDLTFEETGTAWGFDSRRISHGMALADLDNDGDLDAAVNCLNAPALVYRNDAPSARIAIRLRGQGPNTRGVGARIRVSAPGLPAQTQEVLCGGRYLSSDDFVRVFAAGNATNVLNVEVTWRSGRTSRVTNAPANRVIELDEAAAGPLESRTGAVTNAPHFEDVTHRLNHSHVDEPFDDFSQQPLLPRRLSNLGPGVAWFDFNDDGWEDLIIGAGRGGRLGVYRNDGKGGFIPQRAKMLETAFDRDVSSVLGWRPSATNVVLLLGLSSPDPAAANTPALREISLVTGEHSDDLWRSGHNSGPLALADVDRDGDLDLFAGGRAVPGRYPEPARSGLLRNREGRLQFDPELSSALADTGMVSGAIWTDFDADGWPDLALACDWGSIRILRNHAGKLNLWNPPVTWENDQFGNGAKTNLQSLSGAWNSIGAGDFDNDGRMDLVAGNWGRNTSRQRFLQKPVRLHWGNVPGSSAPALIEAVFDSELRKWVPLRDFGSLGAALPGLRDRFHSYTTFSMAGLEEVLGAASMESREVSISTLDSIVLLNRGDRLVVRALPVEAQLSPVFGIVIADLDGDGNQDLFLAQNFFGTSTAESRQDAGCGLWLRGDGAGGFTAVPPGESGVAVDGEGRGAAACDFDHDGRIDFVVGQHRGPTRLFRNVRGRPGLRIRLEGRDANPRAVGAVVRVVYADGRMGPAHEVQLGGGYWSQDAHEIVLGTAEAPDRLLIRWPDSTLEEVRVPTGQTAVTRRWPGSRSF